MKRPTLHRDYESWRVGDYPLLLVKAGPRCWVVVSNSIYTFEWLLESGLAGQTFQTRRDAFDAALDAMEIHGGLEEGQPPQMKKTADGYRLAGGMIARGGGRSGWTIYLQGDPIARSGTLRQAAEFAAAEATRI